ncbi:MAG: aldehyde dehydrogenase family protein [Actinomycetota bacterium]|nr:aldehyde dehydrogenase family protein [Actinomycetota bacterium]
MTRSEIPNLIAGELQPALSGEWLEKLRPADGTHLCRLARSQAEDVDAAVRAARAVQPEWAERTPVERGEIVRELALLLRERRDEAAEIVVAETGKSLELALGEADAAVEMGLFVAGEGRRSYGRTTTSAMKHRTVLTVRQPLGVAGLITSFNTPLPNIAWKAFPAIFCGNTAVVKPSEHVPASALFFAELALEAGVPAGVLNVVQGLGAEAGAALVEHEDVDLVSFTGSAGTGRWINETAGRRLAKVCLELGGKNALVVCDDADLDNAVRWALSSAFSNAGQRCAAASRIVVFERVYDAVRDLLVSGSGELKPEPVISEPALERMLAAIDRAVANGARVLTGGERVVGPGFRLAPTILEEASPADEISRAELFGPVTLLYRVSSLDEAVALVNDSRYGLTAAIHTASLHRALRFAEKAQAGVIVVNGGTHGSEPHMGFGGVKDSGTGWREAGIEALDVYSDWKIVNLIADPALT